jgi:hypothetical protein
MPSGSNWLNFVYVNIAFVIYMAGVFYYNQLAEIKADWPKYRCNPMYMFLADNVEENFTYCIQNMQTGFMGYLLEPITFVTNSLTSQLGGFSEDIQNIRAMFDKIRTFFSSIVQNIFGVFLNLIIEFQRITIGIKDLMGKSIGIMVSLMYVMDGSIKTMNSTWNGPPGQMVRALGKCFHPNTRLLLQNQKLVSMKNIELGDVLEDGSIVETILKIDNRKNTEYFYKILDNSKYEYIFVTGSHLVYDERSNTFIKVENYHKAEKTNKKSDVLYCLITDTHKIQIGDQTFWDWEDHFIKFPPK